MLTAPSAFVLMDLSPFTVNLVEYDCTEQFTMVSNACLIGDDLALSAILATDNLREQKRLDRHVRHFGHELWQQECEHLVFQGNLAKFSQNEKIFLALVHTVQRRLPERAPMTSCRASA